MSEINFSNGLINATLSGKAFSTGSVGYFASTKIQIGDTRYQTQITLVEIGSKGAGKVAPTDTAVFTAFLQPKTFSTGSKGYYDNGKMTINGKRYQYMAQMVAIKSSPEAQEKANKVAQIKALQAQIKALKAK